MAGNQVKGHLKRRDGWTTLAADGKSHATIKKISQKKVRMLPRLLVRVGLIGLIVAIVTLLIKRQQENTQPPSPHKEARLESSAPRQTAVKPTVQILGKYPHDTTAFTQGFTILNRGSATFFVESTGLYGQSALRLVAPDTGKVLKQFKLPENLFGEGVTFGSKDELVMLTWKSKTGLVFDLKKNEDGKTDGFILKREFTFDTTTSEGWGITFDGENYVVSDGSWTLIFWDPMTMKEVRRIDVTTRSGVQKIAHINELEYAKGFIYANVWYQPYIVKIDPVTGIVITVFDLSNVIADAGVDVNAGAVLNGIIYNEVEDVFYITGKLWKNVYKVHLIDSGQ